MDGAVTAFPPQTQRTERDLLRFLTCGSVDDGKSTLIGRLLFETGQVPEDQLATLERDSRRFGTDGTNLDYALLLDGLEAEREQGITIDVAYRYMSTPRRSFIVADTPGHEQYTRNMATGASTCDAAVVLVDAVKGVTAQTARHSRIVALFGIRHVILAVNKIDLVADDPAAFEAIRAAYADLVADLGFSSVTAIPVSARRGDNLTGRSAATPWYEGPSLIEALEDVPVAQTAAARPFRLSIQYVNRPHADFRGYAGTIASGEVRVGDALVVCPGGQAVTLARILSGDVEVAAARAGEAVTLVLAEDTDVARGDVLAHAVDRPAASDRLNVRLLWMGERPFNADGRYQVKLGTRTLPARLTLSGEALAPNEVADGRLILPSPVAVDAFRDDPAQGAFVLIDRRSGVTVAAGVITGVPDQAAHIHHSPAAVSSEAHELLNGHQGGVVWLTGLSGAGKSTVAQALQQSLHGRGCRTVLLDGDNLRHGLNRDLGFSGADRSENVRRTGEAARLFAEAGVIAICALISPRQADRDAVRARFDDDRFVEVFVEASLESCRARDPKGLYARASAGVIAEFTGVAAPYEAPTAPDLTVATEQLSPSLAADAVRRLLEERGWL
ncbi:MULTISPECIES: adenylyl-sulfate kinase [unclassified Brevundimonas]|uniref:adenylyl-sulfate kinase n=1 Tax=unclassified Brevundimonas TaxID=2622653 RepID=UPI000CFD73EF|nr:MULTISPECIES: adenylyl-sulfate kinase [unclassified Brevundimonas]PQZ75774.1 adenylyl-sulfate kinase [Brevundimonas sp. MYb31]PRB18056.1 adenylyl-sulfate kinase [Brevundimonas sp. MYb52]PRB36034.1 adenylyl-sulfate kinase [Brevundimonas sp. MYb46]PRB49388.1 adenylyl-sulfate kinase [Brevundimonas sp. MYb33]